MQMSSAEEELALIKEGMTLRHDLIPLGRKYAGVVIVNCKENQDPWMGSWIVLIEHPIPGGVKDGDQVYFEYTGWFTGRITKNSLDPCGFPRLKVVFDEEVVLVKKGPLKKVATKRSKLASKKAPVKKAAKKATKKSIKR